FLPVTAVLTAGVLLTSCTGSPEPAPTSSPPPSASEPVTGTQEPGQGPAAARPSGSASGPPTSDLQPLPPHAEPAPTPAPDGAQLQLMDVTRAEHEGYDRVVLTFKGAGAPGWRVGYEDSPSEEGSGRPIETEGDG